MQKALWFVYLQNGNTINGACSDKLTRQLRKALKTKRPRRLRIGVMFHPDDIKRLTGKKYRNDDDVITALDDLFVSKTLNRLLWTVRWSGYLEGNNAVVRKKQFNLCMQDFIALLHREPMNFAAYPRIYIIIILYFNMQG